MPLKNQPKGTVDRMGARQGPKETPRTDVARKEGNTSFRGKEDHVKMSKYQLRK